MSDLRMSVAYAARAGLLRDKAILSTLRDAEEAVGNQDGPDPHTLVLALNEVAQAIAPMTIADLKYGRDPFLPSNQSKGRRMQFVLTVLAFIVLLLIGYFMHALQIEQQAIRDVAEIQALQPQLKLTALRKLAQYDEPMRRPSTLYDDYHSKVAELKFINSRMVATYTSALSAAYIPLFPFSTARWADAGNHRSTGDSAEPVSSATTIQPMASSESVSVPIASSATTTDQPTSVPASQSADSKATSSLNAQNEVPEAAFCAEDGNGSGSMRLPDVAADYPKWMKLLLADSLSDFCFQLNVLLPDGSATLLNQSLSQLAFLPQIREKVSLRTTWFLPFLYGLLGSIVFLMRNVASIRTPATEWLPIVMRISLGGVAGIVIGWFLATATPTLETTSSLSVPFALAFLTGYGIEVLFTMLDRLNRAISDARAGARA